MSLQVVTVESLSESRIIGVYMSVNLAKVGVSEYMESSGMSFKKKLVKKDDTSSKKLVFLQDTKESVESRTHVYMTEVPFVMPVGKGKKAKKDPNAPKRGLSAFMLYSNSCRNAIKEANPTAEFGEIGRLVGQSWSSLDTTKKSVFVTLAANEKVKYLAELDRYTNASSEVQTNVTTEEEKPVEVKLSKKTKKVVV